MQPYLLADQKQQPFDNPLNHQYEKNHRPNEQVLGTGVEDMSFNIPLSGVVQ